ncbi:MAG: glycosyltransferase family 1 protein [Chloracidobacterium sp.]|nr:glycosyltransferase family 1 protein [Chloracidobacterium sp.]
MNQIIVTNIYPGHFHYEPLRLSLEPAGYTLISIARRNGAHPDFEGSSVGQFIFNYPMSKELSRNVLHRCDLGEPVVVMMDDPLAFFDENINTLIIPILKKAARVFTSTDNMLPVYLSIGVTAELLVGLGNPLFDVSDPPSEVDMEFDWGFIGTLIPQRFRFFWQLKQLLPDSTHYLVTKGFDVEDVKTRIRVTRCNIAFGNFSDVTDFKSNGTTLRAWEFPYAGAFILHDYRPLIPEFFENGKAIVMFDSVEECAELILHYRDLPSERIKIAENARQIISQYSMKSFFPALFQGLSTHGN